MTTDVILTARDVHRSFGGVRAVDVGEFEDALLDPLQLIPGAREHEHQEAVDHLGDRGLGLTDPDGFDDHDVESRGLAHQHRLAGLLGHAAQRTARRAGPDEGCFVD